MSQAAPYATSSDLDIGGLIIVRNEEQFIADAIASMRPLLRQLVIVDTGSSDSTPRICARHGAELHFFQWKDDFAAARNYGLKAMRCRWILTLDADETLASYATEELGPLLSDPLCGGISVGIRNYLDGDPKSDRYQEHRYTRLFRRHPAIRYRGAIHEQIAAAIRDTGFHIADSNLRIDHRGYAGNDPAKAARNADLLRQELQSHPEDPWLLYHLGLAEFAGEDRVPAADHLRQALASGSELSQEQREIAALRLAQIALASDNWAEVEKRISFTSTDGQREGFRLYLHAVCLAMQRRFAEARRLLQHPLLAECAWLEKQQLTDLEQLCAQQGG